MPTSGTYGQIEMPLQELLDAAFGACRIPPQKISAEMIDKGRRALQRMLNALPARVLPLWAQDHIEVPLVQGVSPVTLPEGTIDVQAVNLRTTVGGLPLDLPLSRISHDDYVLLPTKRQEGRPVQYWVDRQAAGPQLWLWPLADAQHADSAVLSVWRQRHIQDVGSLTQAIEIPARWEEAIVTLLAHRIAFTSTEIDLSVAVMLKPLADEAMVLISADERDSAPITFNFGISGYTR